MSKRMQDIVQGLGEVRERLSKLKHPEENGVGMTGGTVYLKPGIYQLKDLVVSSTSHVGVTYVGSGINIKNITA